jgi:hypothetical protein
VRKLRKSHAQRVALSYEEVGQRLAGISLAAATLDNGGNPTKAAEAIRAAVDEVRQELRRLRDEVEAVV